MLKKFLTISRGNVPNARKTISSISEIPLTFNIVTLFSVTGLACGISLVLVPNQYIQTDVCVPFPNITHLYGKNYENYKLILLFITCSTINGYIGGKVYQYKVFKLGDHKRLYKVLNNLVTKPPLMMLHGAAYPMIVYYGMFGLFTWFDTLNNGKPFGLNDNDPKYINFENGNKHLLGYDKKLSECDLSMIKYRTLFSAEIIAHWMKSTLPVVFPLFFCSSSAIFWTHRSYWISLLSRLKKP
eukprot:538499_1